MKKIFFLTVMTFVPLLFNGPIYSAGEEVNTVREITGLARDVFHELSFLPEPGSVVGVGPMAIDRDSIVVIESVIKNPVEYIMEMLSKLFMSIGTRIISANRQDITVINQRMTMLRECESLNYKTYSYLSDEQGARLMQATGATILLLGRLECIDGVWRVTYGGPDGTDFEVDQETFIRVLRWIDDANIEDVEKVIPDNPVVQVENTREVIDYAKRYGFNSEGRRVPVIAAALNANTAIAIYNAVRNHSNAATSTAPAFVVFNENEILKVVPSEFRDAISGMLVNNARNEFYLFSRDFSLAAYSLTNFQELFRLNTGTPIETLSLTRDNGIVTNFGRPDSKTYSLERRVEVRAAVRADLIEAPLVRATFSLNISSGVVEYMSNGRETVIGYYIDGFAGMLSNDRRNYRGAGIERHLLVREYGKDWREFDARDKGN